MKKSLNSNIVKPSLKLFIGGIPPSSTEQELRSVLKDFGSIVYLSINRYRNGRSKGYGFVKFAKISSSNRAVETSVYLRDVILDISYMKNKNVVKKLKRSELLRKIFFENCPSSSTKQELMHHFSEYGEVEKVVMSYPKKSMGNISKKGFIIFQSEATVEKLKESEISQIFSTKFTNTKFQNLKIFFKRCPKPEKYLTKDEAHFNFDINTNNKMVNFYEKNFAKAGLQRGTYGNYYLSQNFFIETDSILSMKGKSNLMARNIWTYMDDGNLRFWKSHPIAGRQGRI